MRNPLSVGRAARLAGVSLCLLLTLGSAARAGRIVIRDGCTLVDAITAANTDVAVGDCDAGAGPDVLILGRNETLVEPFLADDGLPIVTTRIEIRGGGRTIERVSGIAFRLFNIAEGGRLELVETTVLGGLVDSPPTIGGCILNRGELTLDDSTVAACRTRAEMPLINQGALGGGVYNSGNLTLSHSVVKGNSAGADEDNFAGGGGIYSRGTLVITDSTLSGNGASAAVALGGGLFNGGTAVLTGSTVSGNSVYAFDAVQASGVVSEGGGIRNVAGASLALTNATVSGNSASAIGNYAVFSYGGGLSNDGEARLLHSTLAGNTALALGDEGESFFSGGGIANGGNATLTRSVVALGSPDNCSGTIDDGGHNFGCAGPVVTAFDADLADHGGPTMTHQLWPGSNAIDPAPGCGQGVDQRLAGRTDGACDSGSFEEIGCVLLELEELTLSADSSYTTCGTAVLGPGLLVAGSGGVLRVSAGGMIGVRNGFVVESGAEVQIGIDSGLLPL